MDLKTIVLGSDTVIVTENANGDPYLIQAKYLQDIVDDWNGECNFVPSNDAKVFFATVSYTHLTLPTTDQV